MLRKALFVLAGMVLSVNGLAQAQDLIQISDSQTWADFDEGGFGAGDTLQILAGGDLTVRERSRIQDGRHLIVEEGGRFTIDARLDTNSEGKITMNGGEFYANVDFKFPDNAGQQNVEIWLHGGLMVCAQIQSMRDRGSTLYVGGGILRVGNTSAGGDWDPENADEWAIVPIPPHTQVNITDLGGGWKEVWSPSPLVAYGPNPADGATDVVRDPISNPIVLSWTPSPLATKRDVYIGKDLDAVSNADRGNPLDVLAVEGQVPATYTAVTLEYGRTYYWRIDEVNDAEPDSPWKGDVWSFTVEPYSYPIETITATASSSLNADYGPERTIDGSGLNDGGEHSADMDDMWVSDVETDGAWIQYVFDDTCKLDMMWVWNFNAAFEGVLGWGLKDVTIEQTDNGTDWSVLRDATLNQGISTDNYAANTVVDLEGTLAQGLRLTARNNWRELIDLYGLSEVQITRIIGYAREPQPVDGAEDVDPGATLAWRVGREAAQHLVYVGESEDELTLVDTVGTNHFELSGLDLELGRTYYWRIDEVNDAEVPSVWESDVWHFNTPEYLVVDDFESYTNDASTYSRVFQTWIDGAGYTVPVEVPGNGTGSFIGHDPAIGDIMETAIVHGGAQSAPFYFGSGGQSVSEVDRTFAEPQDWTANGIKTLSLWFHGAEGNTGQLYVKINNAKVLYAGATTDIATEAWQPFEVDLSTVNTNVANVTTLSIGVEGTGSGVVYIDDIQLRAD